MQIGETVTIIMIDGSGADANVIVGQTDTHVVVYDGVLRWHIRKDHIKRNNYDGVLHTTSNHVFLDGGN